MAFSEHQQQEIQRTLSIWAFQEQPCERDWVCEQIMYLDVMLNVVDVKIMFASSQILLGLLLFDDVETDSYWIDRTLS